MSCHETPTPTLNLTPTPAPTRPRPRTILTLPDQMFNSVDPVWEQKVQLLLPAGSEAAYNKRAKVSFGTFRILIVWWYGDGGGGGAVVVVLWWWWW